MKVRNPEQIKSYFLLQKKNLVLITITGIIYNIGMTAGPFFEGRLAQCLYDIMGGRKTWIDMMILAAVYVGVLLLVQANRAVKRFYVRRFANDTSKNMRHMLYNSIVHTEKRKLEQEQMGSLMTKAISDVDACVEGMRKFTTEIFDTGIVLIAYAVMLCIYDVRLALLSGLFIPVAYIIAEKCKGVVTKYNESYKKSSGRLNQATMDLVGNAITYRVFGLEHRRTEIYEKDLESYEKNAVKANVWESALQPIYYVISMCGAVLIFYFGSKNVLGTGWSAWDIGVFTTFFSCFTKLALKSSKAAKLFNAVQKANVSWKRIKPMFREYVEERTVDKEQSIQEISFEHTDIQYPVQPALLHDITFKAKTGQIIGITGEVASGKSAIGKVLIEEADYCGSVKVNGLEFSQILKENKRSMVTYMGHEPELMSTSIEENIMLQNKSKSELMEYLKEVCLEQEIMEMPDGVNTIVGNGGVRLSGGQQARVALARCFAHEKDIFVLDDPFSAVDKKTEQTIFKHLREINKDRITLLVSHRLWLFPSLDGVLYLHDGTASFGRHDELMVREPGYERLFTTQGGGNHVS